MKRNRSVARAKRMTGESHEKRVVMFCPLFPGIVPLRLFAQGSVGILPAPTLREDLDYRLQLPEKRGPAMHCALNIVN